MRRKIIELVGGIALVSGMFGCGAKEPESSDGELPGSVTQELAKAPGQRTSAGEQISPAKAMALLAQAPVAEEPEPDLASLLVKIPQTDGTERQQLLGQYMVGADRLSPKGREQAVAKLVELFAAE